MNVIAQFPAAQDFTQGLRFQAMFEGAAMGIGICQLDGRLMDANPALGRMLGYSPEELTGAPTSGLYPGIGPRPYSGNGLPDDGLSLIVLPGNSLADDCLPAQRLLRELLRGERGCFEIEKRYQRKDGSELWGHLTVSLGRDERRQPAFLITVLEDATERRQVQEHLREAEKMEVIGRLAGGIAHDFNNLLTGILLYCDLLSAGLERRDFQDATWENAGLADMASANSGATKLESTDLESMNLILAHPTLELPALALPAFEECESQPDKLRQHVEEVRKASEQGAALTQQLLAIARKQASEPRPISVNHIVTSSENLLRRLIGEQIELITALDSTVGLVLADPAQLRQIVLNLVLNARDALPRGGGGKIRLITRTSEFPRESPGDFASGFALDSCPGSTRHAVSLAVKDNGCGMDVATRTRLFEPFFTTKRPGEGTGLGLATVQRIVSEAGGRIEVESEPGRGTLIEVLLPVIASVPTASLFASALEESAKAASSAVSPQSASPPAPSP
jgi:signal transduction histidine kinase